MRIALSFCTVAVLALSAHPATAATIERSERTMAAGRCQPALPAFDGQVRKRPLAMQNEGTSLAFVTCAFDGVGGDVASRKSLEVGLVNLNPGKFTFYTVTCTLVDAGPIYSIPVYVTESVMMGGDSQGDIVFTAAAHNGGQPFMNPAVSCGLPVGIGIRYTGSRFDEEIGA